MTTKMNVKKGIPGQPKYKVGDTVSFRIIPYKADKSIVCTGTVEIVDRYGTFFSKDNEPSYDVMVENYNETGQRMFCKHIEEHCILED